MSTTAFDLHINTTVPFDFEAMAIPSAAPEHAPTEQMATPTLNQLAAQLYFADRLNNQTEGPPTSTMFPWSSVTAVVAEASQYHSRTLMPFDVRPLSRLNLHAAMRLAADCFGDLGDRFQIARELATSVRDYADSFFEPSLSKRIETKAHFVFYETPESNDPIALIGMCQHEGDDRLWLSWLGVRSDMRGQGQGATILSFCEENARDMGYDTIALYTDECNNDAGKKFYLRNGYEAREVFLIDDSPVRIFEKPLR